MKRVTAQNSNNSKGGMVKNPTAGPTWQAEYVGMSFAWKRQVMGKKTRYWLRRLLV